MPADAAEIKAAVNKAAPRFMEKTVERGDCLVWTASGDGKGYGQFCPCEAVPTLQRQEEC